MRKKFRPEYDRTVKSFEFLLDAAKRHCRPKDPASFPSELSQLTDVVNQHGGRPCEERVILEWRLPDRTTAYGFWNDFLNVYPSAERLMDSAFSSRDGREKARLQMLWDKAAVFAHAVEALGYHDVDEPLWPAL